MSYKEYKLTVPEDDYMFNLVNTELIVSRMIRGLMRLVGPVKVRLILDVIMERFIEPTAERDAGFRASFRDVRSESEIPTVIRGMNRNFSSHISILKNLCIRISKYR